MSKGKLGKARCCPWCGTATLVRDTFTADTNAEHTHVSYICTACCTGFSLRHSPRVMFANRMYATERAQRPRQDEHRMITEGGTPPLSERSTFELTRIEGVLRSKRPRKAVDRASIAKSLECVQAELAKRGVRPDVLTYKLGDIYPPGSLPQIGVAVDEELG